MTIKQIKKHSLFHPKDVEEERQLIKAIHKRKILEVMFDIIKNLCIKEAPAKAFAIMEREAGLAKGRIRKLNKVWNKETKWVYRSKAKCNFGFSLKKTVMKHFTTYQACQTYVKRAKLNVDRQGQTAPPIIHQPIGENETDGSALPSINRTLTTFIPPEIHEELMPYYNGCSQDVKHWLAVKGLHWILPYMEQIDKNADKVSRTWNNIYFDPPSPLLAAQRRGCVKTSDYSKATVYIWVPELTFPKLVKRMPCPNQLLKPDDEHIVHSKGWKKSVLNLSVMLPRRFNLRFICILV